MASGESWQQWCFQFEQQQFVEHEQQQLLAPSPEFKYSMAMITVVVTRLE